MERTCSHCYRTLAEEHFVSRETAKLEAERRAAGLPGLRFSYYGCPGCGCATIFVDVLAQPGESTDQFLERADGLDAAVGALAGEGVRVRVNDRLPVLV